MGCSQVRLFLFARSCFCLKRLIQNRSWWYHVTIMQWPKIIITTSFEGGCRTTVMTPGQPTQSANCPDDKLDKLKNILEIELQNLWSNRFVTNYFRCPKTPAHQRQGLKLFVIFVQKCVTAWKVSMNTSKHISEGENIQHMKGKSHAKMCRNKWFCWKGALTNHKTKTKYKI